MANSGITLCTYLPFNDFLRVSVFSPTAVENTAHDILSLKDSYKFWLSLMSEEIIISR